MANQDSRDQKAGSIFQIEKQPSCINIIQGATWLFKLWQRLPWQTQKFFKVVLQSRHLQIKDGSQPMVWQRFKAPKSVTSKFRPFSYDRVQLNTSKSFLCMAPIFKWQDEKVPPQNQCHWENLVLTRKNDKRRNEKSDGCMEREEPIH